MATFGQRVKELREQASLTQSELAEAVGFKSTRALQYVEADQRAPSHSTLISLAEYFNVSIDYLVGRTDNPELHK
jgi:transcriptional regulator with XRE-family HTH domain